MFCEALQLFLNKPDCHLKNINQKPKHLAKSDAIGRLKALAQMSKSLTNSERSRLDFFMWIIGID